MVQFLFEFSCLWDVYTNWNSRHNSSSLGGTALCPWVLVQPRKTHPDITEKMLTWTLRIKQTKWEPSGSVLDSRPRVRASPASLCCGLWARHIYPSLVLFQPRKTCPCFTERLLMGRKESNQTNKQKSHWFLSKYRTMLHLTSLHAPISITMTMNLSVFIFCHTPSPTF